MHRWRAIVVHRWRAIGLAIVALAVMLGTATNAAAWELQTAPDTPSPSGHLGHLEEVSCVSSTWCMAVGVHPSGNQTQAASRLWNGTSWSSKPVPIPGQATRSYLNGISCTSSTLCRAVGVYFGPVGSTAFAATWNGFVWSLQEVPNPSPLDVYGLEAVDCLSATSCWAVGYYEAAEKLETRIAPLVMYWNGTEWAQGSAPTPSGSKFVVPSGVSCVAATSECMAVGTYIDSAGGFKPYAIGGSAGSPIWGSWNVPAPGGALANSLEGVSCTSSPSACTAVGNYVNSSGQEVPLAERWQPGTGWAVKATPSPSGAKASGFTDVYCANSGVPDCRVVGVQTTTANVTKPLIGSEYNGGWSLGDTPIPADEASGFLAGLSCAGSSNCMGVGEYDDYTENRRMLAERFTGTWSVSPMEAPAKLSSQLTEIACVSGTACTAVGSYVNGQGAKVPLVASWNGASWSQKVVADPGQAELSSVSCPGPTSCAAVGSYSNNSKTLAEAWNGTAWTVQATPNVSGAVKNHLEDVSCVSASSCKAVGFWEDSAGVRKVMALSWNGTTWSLMSPVVPSSFSSELRGVSCTSSTSCTAVGTYWNGSGSRVTLVEYWNGSTWSIQPSANPGTYHVLQAVSCTSASACTAVGGYDKGGPQLTLVERWNGTSWTVQSTPNPTGSAASYLQDVSCSASNACTAVGSWVKEGTNVTLAESWDGSSWEIQPTPNPANATYSLLSGLSCQSGSSCIAVGGATQNGVGINLVERLSGWSLATPATPVGAKQSSLKEVSCLLVTYCISVGAYTNSEGVTFPLSQFWNGATWSVKAPINPGQAELSGVRCGPGWCIAVGSYSNGLKSLAERWNGTSWATQSTPNPAGAFRSELHDISCYNLTSCTAVGSWMDGSFVRRVMAMSWNGTSWSLMAPPVPAGALSSELLGVSCSTPTDCTAVGTYQNSSGIRVTLVERWNGSTWTVQSSPNPGTYHVLQAVSCTAPSACTAVGGYYQGSSTQLTLVERWDGTSWTVQPSANPAGSTASYLQDVTCSGSSSCTAVGTWVKSGTNLTLAEFWNGTAWEINLPPNPAGASYSTLSAVSCESSSPRNCMAVGYATQSGASTSLSAIYAE